AALGVTFAMICGACGVVFFGLIAVQGVLLNVLPARWFERAMIGLQALLASVSLGGFWMAAWKGHLALAGWAFGYPDLGVAVAAALVSYALSFHRYRRLLLEGPRLAAPRRGDWGVDSFVRDPREQAVIGFMLATVRRSPVHRLAVLVYAGLAAAWLGKAVVGESSGSELQRLLFTVYPLGLLVLSVWGMRHLFSLPVELRANWLFQVTEREGRAAWMRATERFVFAAGVVPLVAIGAAFVGWEAGAWTAAAWAAVAFLVGAITFEIVFRDWRKLPFTCSYLPGKRPLLITCTMFLGLSPVLLILAWIVFLSATNPASFLVVLALELGIWRYLRAVRMGNWGAVPLRYVEELAAEVDTFDLAGDGTVVAQEEFQREWSAMMRGGPDAPIMRPLDEGETWMGRVSEWLRAVPQDVHYALRVLRKSPGFVATVVLTLGLGLGLNGAFFTVFNAFLLRPLAVRDPGSLVSVNFEGQGKSGAHLQWKEFETLGAGFPAFTEAAANTLEGTGLEGRSSRVALVSGNFFSMLGVGAAAGRVLRSDDDSQLLVLNYRTWQNRFGGDPGIVGRKVLLNGTPFEVAGVAAPEFAGVAVGTVAMVPPQWARYGVGAPDCWVLATVWDRLPGVRQGPVLGIIGRLRPEMTRARAEAIVGAHARRMTASKPWYDRVRRAELESLDVAVTWTALSYSFPLLIAFGLTMLIPCANAANIMLARATLRQREFGTRLSLGASRGRVVRQLLTEGVFLALLAAGAGLAISRVALDAFSRWLFATAPPTMLHRIRIPDFSLDPYVWTYMAIMAGATTVLFALAPAAQTTRFSVASALRGEFGGWRASGLRDGLVVTQVALCTMLLAASGLLLSGTRKATAIERGYDTTAAFGVANESAKDATALETILRGETWVDTVAVMGRPMNEARTIRVGPAGLSSYYSRGSGEFFSLIRLPLVRGRTFTRDEGEKGAAVAVVSELLARSLWPGADPIGKTIALGEGESNVWKPQYDTALVIGVCRDIVVKARDGGPRPMVYFPDKLRPGTIITVRGKGSTEQTRALMNAAMAKAPGAQHGAWLVALHEAVDWETYPQQAVSWLATILGGVALLLTVSGIYGVMQYLVSQRFKEIGIRMALGATGGQIARFVLSYSGRLASAGAMCGLMLAVGVLQYLGSRMQLLVNLYDIGAYALPFAVAAGAALMAVLGPTRRACRVDPQVALRMD
ncbi:MAG: ABC transporter permease, partial [Bryobacteraceae bacterium]